jgi:GT2 family glycosyltransferase
MVRVSSLPVLDDAPAAHAPAVVVIVVSWNTRDLLDRCLRSLEPDVRAGTARVWVVDNASTDGSPDMVRSRHPWASLLALDDNLGYGPAANLAAARTHSRWLVVANADTELTLGALSRLLAAGERDRAAGILAPRLVLPDGSTQHLAWAFPTIPATLAQNLGPRLLPARLAERLALRGAWNPERARRVPWAVGAFLLIRRTAWDAVGGFDAAQWMSAEDLDLGWRMRRAGWLTRYEPDAVVHHSESSATRTVWGDALPLHWQRCAYAWMLRRLGRGRTATAALLNLAGSATRFAVDLSRAGFRADDHVRALGRWTLVHLYGFAPRRVLERYR